MAGRDSRTGSGASGPGASAVMPAWLRRTADGHELALHVQPGARRRAVVGVHGERLKIAVNVPPADGRANDAVLALLAERLGLPLRAIRLAAGATQRDKRVVVAAALETAAVISRLAPDQ